MFVFGWPAPVIVLEIWFDGITALAALAAFAALGFERNDPDFRGKTLLAWAVVFGLFSIPYWFAFALFSTTTFRDGFWGMLLITPGAGVLFGYVLVSNGLETASRGLHRMGDAQIRREFNWDLHMLLARVITLMLVGFFFRAEWLVVGLVLALSYVGMFPMRALRFFGATETLAADEIKRPD
jgi:hypothetical protein